MKLVNTHMTVMSGCEHHRLLVAAAFASKSGRLLCEKFRLQFFLFALLSYMYFFDKDFMHVGNATDVP